MNTYTDKNQEKKSQSVANAIAQKQNGGKSTFQFVDNRPESVAQRKLQEIVHNNTRISKLGAIQNITNNRPQAKQVNLLQDLVVKKPMKTSVIQLQTVIKHKTKNFKYHSPIDGSLQNEIVGDSMEATLDPAYPKQGSSPGGEQDELMARLGNIYPNPMVKGHLLNGGLGGLGIAPNLFPITVAANNKHKTEVENPVKQEITNGNKVKYEVEVFDTTFDEQGASATLYCEAKTVNNGKVFVEKQIGSNPGNKKEAAAVYANVSDNPNYYDGISFPNSMLPHGWGEHGSGGRGVMVKDSKGNVFDTSTNTTHAYINK